LIEEKSSKAPDAHDMLPTEDSGIHKEDDAEDIPLSQSNVDELAPKDMTKLPVGSGIRKDDDVANIPSIEEAFDKEIQVDLTIPTIDDAVIIPLIEDTTPKSQNDNEITPTDESGSHKEDDAVVTPLIESNVDEQQSEENVASLLEKGGATVREATIELSIEDVLRQDPEMSKYMCWGSFLDNKPSVKDSSNEDCTVEPTTEAEATKVDAETSRFLTEAVQRQEDGSTILEIKSDSPVPQASSSSTVRNEADPPPSIHVSGVTKEDSFIQRFIECRENLSSAKKGISDNLLATTQNHLANKKDVILFTTLIYPVNKNCLFAIEGHREKVRNGLCKDYHVQIKIHKEQAKVSIIGKKERCEEALVAIQEIVSRQEKLVANLDSDWDV